MCPSSLLQLKQILLRLSDTGVPARTYRVSPVSLVIRSYAGNRLRSCCIVVEPASIEANLELPQRPTMTNGIRSFSAIKSSAISSIASTNSSLDSPAFRNLFLSSSYTSIGDRLSEKDFNNPSCMSFQLHQLSLLAYSRADPVNNERPYL